jgi:hypothetical protein
VSFLNVLFIGTCFFFKYVPIQDIPRGDKLSKEATNLPRVVLFFSRDFSKEISMKRVTGQIQGIVAT